MTTKELKGFSNYTRDEAIAALGLETIEKVDHDGFEFSQEAHPRNNEGWAYMDATIEFNDYRLTVQVTLDDKELEQELDTLNWDKITKESGRYTLEEM